MLQDAAAAGALPEPSTAGPPVVGAGRLGEQLQAPSLVKTPAERGAGEVRHAGRGFRMCVWGWGPWWGHGTNGGDGSGRTRPREVRVS